MMPQFRRAATLTLGVVALVLVGLWVGFAVRLWTAPAWVEVETPGCTIKFPRQPVREVSPAPDPWLGGRMNTYRVELDDTTYQLDEIEVDLTDVTNDDLARLMAATNTALNGTLDSQSRTGNFLIHLGDGSAVRGRMYAVRGRGYVFRLLVAKTSVPGTYMADAILFLDSLVTRE